MDDAVVEHDGFFHARAQARRKALAGLVANAQTLPQKCGREKGGNPRARVVLIINEAVGYLRLAVEGDKGIESLTELVGEHRFEDDLVVAFAHALLPLPDLT